MGNGASADHWARSAGKGTPAKALQEKGQQLQEHLSSRAKEPPRSNCRKSQPGPRWKAYGTEDRDEERRAPASSRREKGSEAAGGTFC